MKIFNYFIILGLIASAALAAESGQQAKQISEAGEPMKVQPETSGGLQQHPNMVQPLIKQHDEAFKKNKEERQLVGTNEKGLLRGSKNKAPRELQLSYVAKNQDLARYEALWKSKNVVNYHYNFQYTGSNNYNVVYPWSVSVRNRVSASGKDGNGNTILYKTPHPVPMEEHFQRIRNALNDGVKYIQVRYDPKFGYPVDIYIVYNDSAAGATYDAEIYGFYLE